MPSHHVHVEKLVTSLPIYKIYDNGLELDITRMKDEKAFKRLLVRDDDLELRAEELPDSKLVQFRLFDAPGLDDTDGNDVQRIARIFSALGMVDTINLVIIMGSQHVPLLPSQKAAYQAYFDLLPELKSLMMVLHTHVPNHHRYPGINARLDAKLEERAQFFKSIKGQVVPTMRIDCDLEETAPAHLYMTRNTIGEILVLATIKIPIAWTRTHVHKLTTMTAVDDIVHRRYKAKLDSVFK
ncbi:hypothetical protein BGZ65_002386 [Modicella reniformis]|uniref:Uncharacterized protein n=1 Tax=Modicella reniformis TaxID=1440133 RepID=A0A9P6SN20_9FUNG|nr:hypothetical protein BGZ65_002386 [Modicella reniformis]